MLTEQLSKWIFYKVRLTIAVVVDQIVAIVTLGADIAGRTSLAVGYVAYYCFCEFQKVTEYFFTKNNIFPLI